jgi:hypothetical protein
MNGVDAVIFTAGIGENSPSTRAAIAAYFRYLGCEIDPELNKIRGKDLIISIPESRVKLMVIPHQRGTGHRPDTRDIVFVNKRTSACIKTLSVLLRKGFFLYSGSLQTSIHAFASEYLKSSSSESSMALWPAAHRRKYRCEPLQALVQIYRYAFVDPEGADASDRVPDQFENLFCGEHGGFGMKEILEFAVVHPSVAGGAHKRAACRHSKRKRFGDPCAFHAEGLRRKRHRGAGDFELDDPRFHPELSEVCASLFDRHDLSP